MVSTPGNHRKLNPMKINNRNSLLGLFLGVGFVGVALFVIAQQTPPSSAAAKLQQAVALINDGQPQQARDLIATIVPSEPEYQIARFYDAFALYELKDYPRFLKLIETLPSHEIMGGELLRENLGFKQIDALFQQRRFEELLPQTEAFSQKHPDPSQLSAVAEYRLASLFERGMKKTYEACATKDSAQFTKRWAEGKANLEEFLSLAAAMSSTNYTAFPKRKFQEDIWTARLTLGDEVALLHEVSSLDATIQERVHLLRVQLYQKLQPDQLDQNFERMTAFIMAFPDSPNRKRFEFDLAGISFVRGKQLTLEADALERSDASGATGKRALAGQFFKILREAQPRVEVDSALGLAASDLHDLRADVLYSYYLENDHTTLSTLTTSLLTESTPGDMNWLLGKVYAGINLASQTPPAAAAAAQIFDEVLAHGFANKPNWDSYMVLAVRWRFNLALKAGDQEKLRNLYQTVEQAGCTRNLQAAFLRDHARLAGLPQPTPPNSK
jgi:hypothetical protein